MVALLRFLFVFFLGWMGAVWVYDVKLPVESVQDLIHNKVKDIKNSEFLGMRLFEKLQDTEDISLPRELKP